MKRVLIGMAALLAATAHAGMEDDPLLLKVMVDQLEARAGDDDTAVAWEAEAWLGRDLHKLWLKTEGERLHGENEEAELQLLYSRAVDPYWDLQVGWRRAFEPGPDRDWLALGFRGIAPYHLEVDAALFLGDSGRAAARLGVEYELMFTQRWVLTPELELNFQSADDPLREIGSGLTDASLGLRLSYQIRREFAPYIGIHWARKVGDTADYARAAGEDDQETRLVAGIRAWF